MFFIGAPLGAIIRKGGLGLPIVFAVLIFIIFHFINTFGKKMAQEDGITPFMGAWMSTFVLSPLAVLLTYRATNDIGLINMDSILMPLQKLFFKRVETEESRIIKLDTVNVVHDDEWRKMNGYEDNILIGIVKNSKQFEYSFDYRTKALKILQLRGITQQELLATGDLFNAEYEELQKYLLDYKRERTVAMIFYVVALLITGIPRNINIIAVAAIAIVTLVIFYLFIVKSNKSLEKIGTLLNRKVGIGLGALLLLGLPFYIFIFFYERKTLKDALSEFNKTKVNAR